MDILKIEILPSGEIAIYPSEPKADFQYVYRAAAGVYWDNNQKRFHHNFDGYNARELLPHQWFKYIIGVLFSEMGLDLRIKSHTQWMNVSEAQKNLIITSE